MNNEQVILEMCEEVARRARTRRKAGRTVSLGIGYSHDDFGGGFHRSKTIDQPTNVTMELYRVCLDLFYQHYNGKTVRNIAITLGNIADDKELQLSLFDSGAAKRRELGYTVDRIRARFGSRRYAPGCFLHGSRNSQGAGQTCGRA
jgi:DNA polymerase V